LKLRKKVAGNQDSFASSESFSSVLASEPVMLFAELDVPAIMALSIPILAVGIGFVSVLAGNWRKAKVAEYRAVVIQNMLDKGFTSDEIEKILAVSDLKADRLSTPCTHRRRHAEIS
jgi:hypothetical protein